MTAKQVVAPWGDFKDWLSHALHVSHAVLHVAAGLLLYAMFAWATRERWGSWRPLLPVLLLELLNELIDFLRYRLSHWPWRPGPSLDDIAMTMLPVAAVVLAVRLARGRHSPQ